MRGRVWGACIGFFIALIGGFMIVSYIYPSLDLDGPEYFFPFLIFAVVGIGLLSIFGSIIGWVFGWVLEPSEPKNMDEQTNKKKIDWDPECICGLIIIVIIILFIMFGIDIPSWLSL